MATPSVVVVGGGTMGLASAWALARRGCTVTVLERHGHLHDLGSHSGYTRIIRQAYHEGSGYVPLIQEADEQWVALGERAGIDLLVRTGLLEFGPPNDPEYVAAIEACRQCGVEHTLFNAIEANRRWPFVLPEHWTACLSPSGGYLRVGPCFDALRAEARAHGASFRYGTEVVEVGADFVRLGNAEVVSADRVVIAAGVGAAELAPSLRGNLHCLRRTLLWFAPPPERRDHLAKLPVWGAFTPSGFFYGFPHNDEGICGLKVAVHTGDIEGIDVPVSPDAVDRELRLADIAPVQRFASEHFPDAAGPAIAHRVCMYTVTPSWDFIVDQHPDLPNVVVAAGFSGHGFKFAPTIGRIVADLVLGVSDAPPMPELRLAHHQRGS